MKRFTWTLSLLLLTTACQNESPDQEGIVDPVEQHQETESHSTEEIAIVLNEGKKWKVNSEMLPDIEKCEQAFNDFEGENYAALSEEMMKHTNNLIQSCTMEGKSHDELHKWLHPHIELVKQLGSEDQDQAEEAFEDLSASFSVFHSNFE